tara:strand:+ start:928 stop:1209 length:282 start_codon:yes stop_codon:yes gene_type:complete
MEKVKLKSGTEYTLKKVTRDELDDITDALLGSFNQETGAQATPNKIMTLWFRSCIKDMSEDILIDMSFEERAELFGILQNKYFVGEEKASSSS